MATILGRDSSSFYKGGRVVNEEQIKSECTPCLIPREILKHVGQSPYFKPKNLDIDTFSVGEIARCLRSSWYERTGTPPDFPKDDILSEGFLHKDHVKKLLHEVLTQANGWRELPITMPVYSKLLDKQLSLTGRLDYYNYMSQELADVKVTDKLEWQLAQGHLPRAWNILQLQYYDTMTWRALNMSKLVLLYAHSTIGELKHQAYDIPRIDRSSCIESRMNDLFTSLYIMEHPPNPELSSACRYCAWRKRCKLETGQTF